MRRLILSAGYEPCGVSPECPVFSQSGRDAIWDGGDLFEAADAEAERSRQLGWRVVRSRR